ncbi:MAG: hypothetical protein IKM61_00065 [Eubacteriaceae bacterium]|nr:hypothetical protein [Eubacteriaceae bacterium]
MKNKIIILSIWSAIFFLIMLCFENTYNCNAGKSRESNVVYNYADELFTSSLTSEPPEKRVSFDEKDYDYINAVDLEVRVENLLSASYENPWQEHVYKKIIEQESYHSYFVTGTLYSPSKDIIRYVINVLNGEVVSVTIRHEYDVTNPSYADFIILSQEMQATFMDSVGIEKMETVKTEEYYDDFEIQEEEYLKAGYTTNEITFRKWVDEENKTLYLFVAEHYSKESPDRDRNETGNIA